MRNRLLPILLAGLLLTQALTACSSPSDTGNNETDAGETDTAAETVLEGKEAYYASLPGKISAPGVEISFLTEVSDLYWEEEALTGERMNDAMYNRNLEVEERLDVVLSIDKRTQGTGEVEQTIEQNVLADSGAYDCISHWAEETGNMFTKGLLMDMNEVPFLQTEEPWWNQSANDHFTFGGYRFCSISSLNHYAEDLAEMLMFNKDMCIDYSMELPYDLVREGKWTLDAMFGMINDLPLDSNGDGAMDTADIIGMLGSLGNAEVAMVAAGVEYFTKDENDYPVFCLGTETNEAKFSKVFDYLTDMTRVVLVDIYPGLSNPWQYSEAKFKSGEGLFMVNCPVNLSYYAEMEPDFGILPFPKYDEIQDSYRTMTSISFTSCLSMPKIVDAEPGDIGLTLDLLSYLSYVDVEPDYVNSYLENRYVRDEDSAEMLGIILSNLYYDPGFVMNKHWSSAMAITGGIVKSGENTFASTIASHKAAIDNAVEATKDLLG